MTPPVPPASRLGIVSDRRRLVAATGRPLDDATALLVAQVEAAAAAGAGFFQLREPDLDARALDALTRRLVEAAVGRTRLVVNDRADVAALAAAGLHLKHTSLSAASVQAWLPPATWLSRAVHSADDARTAGPVDAIVAGTVAATQSKPAGVPTLGAAGLTAIVAVSRVPVFAIGGLGPADWRWVASAGAWGVAGIGAFLPRLGEDPGEAVARALAAFIREID